MNGIIYYLYQYDELVYVGQTENNLSERLKYHKRKKKQWNQIKTLTIPLEKLNDVERFLIIIHKPKYNKVLPPSEQYINSTMVCRWFREEEKKEKRTFDFQHFLKHFRQLEPIGKWKRDMYYDIEDFKKIIYNTESGE